MCTITTCTPSGTKIEKILEIKPTRITGAEPLLTWDLDKLGGWWKSESTTSKESSNTSLPRWR